MSLKKFIFSKTFLIHFSLSIAVTVVLIILTMLFLNIYTRHGSFIKAPNVTGMTIANMEKTILENDLEFVIIDSIYPSHKSHIRGTVIDQEPKPNSKVKTGRKIYITVVAMMAEKVKMPELKDLTLRQATSILESYGLKVGKLTYAPDIAKNAVLNQKHKGKKIEAGTLIEKGSSIDLTLGSGL